MLTNMTTGEIVHWISELTLELANRSVSIPTREAPPWLQQPAAPEPPRWQPPRQEPKAKPFTAQAMPISVAPMPSGGLPPGTPLTQGAPAQQPSDQIAALMAQVQALMGGQQASTPAPQRGVITATAKTDPEAARVMMGVPPRPDGVPPINGAGVVAGSAIVEPA